MSDIVKQNKRMAFNYIARMRWNIRRACEAQEMIWSWQKEAKHKADQIKAQPGFVYSEELYQLERFEHWCQGALDHHSNSLRAFGQLFKSAVPLVNATLTFDEMCDVLNVNVVDRQQMDQTPDIMFIAFIHAAENSAENRKKGFKDTPLFNAFHLITMDFLRTPQGQEVGRLAMRDVFGIDMGRPGPEDDEGWRDAGPVAPKSPLILH